MKSAELISPSFNGGEEFLQMKKQPDFWRSMAIKNRKLKDEQKTQTSSSQLSIREIIKEKEVIVKIRCPYCRTLYDETKDKCPTCGATH
jgi:rubrerythrin